MRMNLKGFLTVTTLSQWKLNMSKLKDSGDRRKFKTGAVRDMSKGKGRMDLLPMRALIEVSKIYEAGCEKYGERNWEKGIPLHSYVDSAMRHLAKFMIGKRDEPHLRQAIWNLLCLLELQERILEGVLPQELNDLPHGMEDLKDIWNETS